MNKELENKIVDNKLARINLIQNAMLFYAQAEQVEDEIEQMIFDEAYEMLGEMYLETEKERS